MDKNKSTAKSLTIGRLIKELKKTYPDISSSKLRFLESQGLISPKRTSNKYRIYTIDEVNKINFILKMQKDFYLPLDVIKEKLNSKQFKEYIKDGRGIEKLQLSPEEEFKTGQKNKFYTLDELKKKIKLPRSLIDDLLNHDLIESNKDNGKILINGDDIQIIKMAKELSKYGIQVKHLKMFENFAVRHSTFIQQIIMPLMVSSRKDLHKKGKIVALRLERDLCCLHELLLKKEDRKFLEKNK
ncbi:MAG: MerR family transcriptional regulator [Actinomycetia bacterium]|nr:MerR family transcriptional regulator [Actinomycetes bacterium]